MDKEIRQKLLLLWCNRLVLGAGIIAVSGFSIIQVQALISYRSQVWSLEAQFQEAHAQFQEARAQVQRVRGSWDLASLKASLDEAITLAEARDQVKQNRNRAMLFLLLSWLIILLLVMRRFRNPSNISFETQFIIFFPEECIAELGVLIRRMKKAKALPWEIRLRLLQELLTLFWAFYIQIKLENLRLPSGQNKIDE